MKNVNDVLDNPELFDIVVTPGIKIWQFKVFGRTFKIETYVEEKLPHKISEPVEVCSSSKQAEWICNLKPKEDIGLITIPNVDNIEVFTKYKNEVTHYKKERERYQQEPNLPNCPPN